MNLLFRVLYAQHCRNTHHKMALDALRHLRGDAAERWQELFLKHHTPYLNGSKAPDTQFKDFRNHVLHVRDNYWGGAPQAARRWYDQAVGFIARQDWTNACYSVGVLSHYYMDPIQPFHTGQTEEETKIHRAAEWSINKSYEDLREIARAKASVADVDLPHGDGWLELAVRQGAEKANKHYETLIEHYDFRQGSQDPPAGLDATSREILAELTSYATIGFARIMERAFTEAGAQPPKVSLTLHTYLATVEVPIQWVVGRMADYKEREEVRAIYDEIQRTGKLTANLPEESRIVRDQRAEEKTIVQPPADNSASLPKSQTTEMPTAPQRLQETPRPQTAIAAESPVPLAVRQQESERGESTTLRFYLETEDEVEAAPSIGSKTARRLSRVGVRTVSDLLRSDPTQLSSKMNSSWITPDLVQDWQDQARLACQIPQIRGHDAQFLVACGYRDVATIAAGKPAEILRKVEDFLETSAGQRILRGGVAPDTKEITNWIAWSQQARSLRAA